MINLQEIIEQSFEDRANINPSNAPKEVVESVSEVLNKLNTGELRVASRINNSQEWETHQWIKKQFYYHLDLKIMS